MPTTNTAFVRGLVFRGNKLLQILESGVPDFDVSPEQILGIRIYRATDSPQAYTADSTEVQLHHRIGLIVFEDDSKTKAVKRDDIAYIISEEIGLRYIILDYEPAPPLAQQDNTDEPNLPVMQRMRMVSGAPDSLQYDVSISNANTSFFEYDPPKHTEPDRLGDEGAAYFFRDALLFMLRNYPDHWYTITGFAQVYGVGFRLAGSAAENYRFDQPIGGLKIEIGPPLVALAWQQELSLMPEALLQAYGGAMKPALPPFALLGQGCPPNWTNGGTQ